MADEPKIKPSSLYLDAFIIQNKKWAMIDDPQQHTKDRNMYLNLINSIAINNVGVKFEVIDEVEYEYNTKSEEFGMWIPLTKGLDKKMETFARVLQEKGVDVPYNPITKKFKVKNIRYQSDSLINMRYGRIEIHKYGNDTTLIWPYFNRKLYKVFKGLDYLMTSFSEYITHELQTDGMYMFSEGSNRNNNKLIYYARGKIQHTIEGKDAWRDSAKTYNLTLQGVLDKCYSNIDVQMAPRDVQTLEDEIRSLPAYVPYVGGAYLINNPKFTKDKIADIKEKVAILEGLMDELKRARQLLKFDPEVDTIFFRTESLTNLNFQDF